MHSSSSETKELRRFIDSVFCASDMVLCINLRSFPKQHYAMGLANDEAELIQINFSFLVFSYFLTVLASL